jgi:Bacterial PH domain
MFASTSYGSAEGDLSAWLTAGERLLWSGRPRGGIRLQASDALLIPFSLFWGGFAIFWETMVLRSNAPLFFALWGVPFVLAGLYIIAGRFVVDAFGRGKTLYGLTDRRIVIVSGLFNRQVHSLPLRTLPEITLSERPDRSGTITFGVPPYPMAGIFGRHVVQNWPGSRQFVPPAFLMIENARYVYDLIQQAQASDR